MSKSIEVTRSIALAIDLLPYVLRHVVARHVDPEPRLVSYSIGDLTPADVDQKTTRMISIDGFISWGGRLQADVWLERKDGKWKPARVEIMKGTDWSNRKNYRFVTSDLRLGDECIALPNSLRNPK